MKKAVVALFASVALVLGMGAMGSTATAAEPYSNTVETYSIITRTASVTEGRYFYTKVVVAAGNAIVDSGEVTVRFGGRSYTEPVNGGIASFRVKAPGVNKTKYKTMNATYKRVKGTVFRTSHATTKLKVKNRR